MVDEEDEAASTTQRVSIANLVLQVALELIRTEDILVKRAANSLVELIGTAAVHVESLGVLAVPVCLNGQAR